MDKIKNLEGIQNLISNQVEENLYLEYKAADALGSEPLKKTEISKDVSAFANANGGTLIYGVKEFSDKEKKHLPESIDPINRLNFTKERLEQIINSNIFPRINNLQIFPIDTNGNSNEVLYIIHIPKSDTAHQASDKRYYKRYNFEVQAMYDHEVRDIMNRNKFPRIELKFLFEQETYEAQSPIFTVPTAVNYKDSPIKAKKEIKTRTTLLVYGENTGQVLANYVNCFLEISTSIIDQKEHKHNKTLTKLGIDLTRIYCDNTIREIKEVVPVLFDSYNKYWPSRFNPILPGTNTLLKEIPIKEGIDLNKEFGMIYYSIHADNAEKREGEIHTAQIKITKTDMTVKK